MKKRVVLLPGDGIGPEVSRQAVKVLKGAGTLAGLTFEFDQCLIGGACLAARGVPIEADTIARCQKSDAVFLGAVGSPDWDHAPQEKRPEKGLLAIRKELGVFTNLRPIKAINALKDASTLKPEVVKDIDILVVRELTGGIYFGEPRLLEPCGMGHRAVDSMIYHTDEIHRIAKVAFDLARNRRQHVTSVDKANILATSQLWRKSVEEVAAGYPDVTLEHMLVDNGAMQLVRNPARFDVLLTTNMFGDILSDEASMLTGSLGMMPSASLGDGPGLFEPVHGSAPDIAGKNVANPLAAIASVAMMFRHSFQRNDVAKIIEQAIDHVLASGCRTQDLKTNGEIIVGTEEMGELVMKKIACLWHNGCLDE